MNTLDFFIKKGDSIQVNCYAKGYIGIEICMERNSSGRIERAIGISKDEKGLVELNCYEDWGGDGEGSASILDDELKALLEFIPAFMSGLDQISQISSLLLKSENDRFSMLIRAFAADFEWNNGTCDQYSCSISKNLELHFKGAVPEETKQKMSKVARLIWDGE